MSIINHNYAFVFFAILKSVKGMARIINAAHCHKGTMEKSTALSTFVWINTEWINSASPVIQVSNVMINAN